MENIKNSIVEPSSSQPVCFCIKNESIFSKTDLNNNCLIVGNCIEALKKIPDECVQTIVTSPPYWSLRDYGIEGQIGLDESLSDYVNSLASLFDEAKRILKPNGTFWLNIGDSYTSGNRKWRAPDRKNPARAMGRRPATPEGLKPKDLIGVPWRIAFALQERGWFLRSEVIWHKPNAQPESVRDRPTNDHEQIFLFSKEKQYKYNVDAVTGPNGRRLRTVWDIKTKANPAAKGHFATFPEELVERCLLLTSDAGDLVLDPFMGSGTTAAVAGKTGRRFLGSELNPEYMDICRNRLINAGFHEV